MKTQSKKCDSKAEQVTKTIPAGLTLEEEVAYANFLLTVTQKARIEGTTSIDILNSLIRELQNEVAMQQEENNKYREILRQNKVEFQRMAEERKSEDDLWTQLGPQIEVLEKNMNHAISKRVQYEESCTKLKEVQAEYEKQRDNLKRVENLFKRKEEEAIRIEKQLQWQDSEMIRLEKMLADHENQNEEMFTLKKRLNNELQQIKGNIRVYCRVRPSKNGHSIISVTSDNTLKVSYERERNRQDLQKYEQGYIFQQIFDQNETQHSIFTQLSQLIQSSIEGKNICIFAYGQTGSGKTYTLLGPEQEGRSQEELQNEIGIVPRSIKQVFHQLQLMKKFRWTFKVFLSIQEIYLQNIIDLIAKTETVKDGCVEQLVYESWQVLTYMKQAALNRKKAATNVNQRSSRSHLIITLRLEGFNDKTNEERKGSLVFVDLAGSERLKQSKVEGQLLKETQFINKSLSALGSVINEIRRESDHVSFRNSKLTHVLQKHLVGDSKTLMFVNVSPDHEDMFQTKISLGFAESVRECKVKK